MAGDTNNPSRWPPMQDNSTSRSGLSQANSLGKDPLDHSNCEILSGDGLGSNL